MDVLDSLSRFHAAGQSIGAAMRISILVGALFLVAEATAQEPPEMLRQFQDVLSRFLASEQPIEGAESGDLPEARRQALWESATKLTSDDESNTNTSPQATAASPHPKEQCLDPRQLQPGLIGYLDYYMFKVVDMGPNEVYLEGEHSKEPICLTNVDSEKLQKSQLVAVLGNVRVLGTKVYKTAEGEKMTVRIVKLLTPAESEFADAQRAIIEKQNPIRTWTSKDGKHKVDAKFLRFADGKVHLVNSAGKQITISPNNLSVEDREYYRALVKKALDARRKQAEAADADAPATN
jgi:hypothetical protein